MSLRPGIKCLQSFVLSQSRSPFILRTSFRFVKDKHWDKNLKDFNQKDETQLKKVRITLKDQKGNIMGDKLLIEAQHLAHKLNLNLIEDIDPSTHFKYKVFKLVSNQYLTQMDADSDVVEKDSKDMNDSEDSLKENKSSILSQTSKEVKHLMFSTKLNENDLMTKINQIKRWLSRGHQIAINITNLNKDPKLLDDIYTKFETELKGFAKFNQKKIKSNNTLKFMIVSAVDTKQQKTDKNDDQTVIDVENMDPNKLLSDEFEKELEKK